MYIPNINQFRSSRSQILPTTNAILCSKFVCPDHPFITLPQIMSHPSSSPSPSTILLYQAITNHATIATRAAALLPFIVLLFSPALLGVITTKPVCVGVPAEPPQVAPCPGHPILDRLEQILVALATAIGPLTTPPPPPAVNPPPGAEMVTPFPATVCGPPVCKTEVQEV